MARPPRGEQLGNVGSAGAWLLARLPPEGNPQVDLRVLPISTLGGPQHSPGQGWRAPVESRSRHIAWAEEQIIQGGHRSACGALAVGLLGTASACVQGPNYSRPTVAIPS